MADFTYVNFTYDKTTNSYKNSEQKTEVFFEFENNVLRKLVIKYYDSPAVSSIERTITFGNAEIEVPTVE